MAPCSLSSTVLSDILSLAPSNPLEQPTLLPSTLSFGGFPSDMVTQKLWTSAGPSLECFSFGLLGRHLSCGAGEKWLWAGPESSTGYKGWQKNQHRYSPQ